MSKVCPKCESRKWMTGIKLSQPETGWIGPNTLREGVKRVVSVNTASICADCGHTEFQATCHPEAWEEWRKFNA